jgi:hypothetical protein
MLDELSTVEKVVEEFFINLMTERVMSMSPGIQASSMRTVQESPSTCEAGPSRPSDENQTKHRDDLVNAKMIPSILPAYLPPLSSAINRDSVPRDFEYALVTAYLSKGIRSVCTDQEKIATLKFSNFNLGNQKFYNMLALHKYLTRT